MVHINSLVMKRVLFNPFPIISLWELSVAMATKQADHHNFCYFGLPLPKQHLPNKRHTALVVLKELSFKEINFSKCNVAMATKQNGPQS